MGRRRRRHPCQRLQLPAGLPGQQPEPAFQRDYSAGCGAATIRETHLRTSRRSFDIVEASEEAALKLLYPAKCHQEMEGVDELARGAQSFHPAQWRPDGGGLEPAGTLGKLASGWLAERKLRRIATYTELETLPTVIATSTS
jgi:hypothetical protein